MNILGNNSGKLNDIIFENRNKAYGAYAIRASYTDSLKKSILCLSGMVTLLFGSVFVYNKVNAITTDDKGIVIDDSSIKPLIYETIVEMKPLETPVAAAAATAPTGGMPLRIIDAEPTNTTTINMNNPVSGVGTETATGVASVGTETSTVTTIAVVAATATVSSEPVIFAEEMPEYEGGNAGLMNYVAKSIVYPELAKEAGKQGIVYVSFVVNEVGKVESAKVLKGIGLGCDEEVLRVINKMPQWKKPGKNAGHPVKVRFNIPVSFKLR